MCTVMPVMSGHLLMRPMESAAPPAHRKQIGGGGARKFRLAQRRAAFFRRRRKYISGRRGDGIRRLTGLPNRPHCSNCLLALRLSAHAYSLSRRPLTQLDVFACTTP